MTRTFSTGAEHEAGFTLLELLVAIALLGLLSVALLGSTRFGIQVWARSENAMANLNRVRHVQTMLTEELTRAYPMFVASGSSEAHVAFDGDADSVTFLTPDQSLPGALTRVRIAISSNDAETVLTRSSTLELSASSSTEKTVLLQRVKAVSLSYFGSDKIDVPPTWRNTWHNEARLPSLIRIRVAFADKTAGFWPELMVAPRLSADVGCVFDPLTKACLGR